MGGRLKGGTNHVYTSISTAPSQEKGNNTIAKTSWTNGSDKQDHQHGSNPYTHSSSFMDNSESRSPASRRKSTIFPRFMRGWWQEFAWELLSIGSFIALVVLLRHYNDKSLPEMTLGVTLNTIVAILSTTCRAAFIVPVMEAVAQLKWIWFKKRPRPLRDFEIFDNASRGPGGSLLLMFTSKSAIIGFLPALLIVSSLATDTVTQSAVAYPQCPHAVPGNANAVMRRSDSYYWATANTQAVIGLTTLIHAAVPRALYTTPQEQLLYGNPNCTRSNCTWEDFSTLAICFDMQNITDQLVVAESTEGFNSANLTLPSDITLSMEDGFGAVKIEAGDSLKFPEGTGKFDASLLSLFVLKADLLSDPLRYRATEILLHWCVNTYNVDTTDNVPTVKLVTSSVETNVGDVFVPSQNASKELRYLTTPADPNTKYPADGMGVDYIKLAITDDLVGQFQDFGGPMYTNGTEIFAASMHINTLINDLNISLDAETKMVDDAEWAAMTNMSANLATSLSNVLTSTEAIGTAWDVETYVSVRWPYLSLLAAQVALSIVVLIYVVTATAINDIKILKTAPLPSLFAIPGEEKLGLERDYADGSRTTTVGIAKSAKLSRITITASSMDGRYGGGMRRRGDLWEIR